MKLIIPFIFLVTSLYAQNDWVRWEKVKPKYTNFFSEDSTTIIQSSSSNHNFLYNAKIVYKFFISDLDGDNCAFHPTCSQFFVEASLNSNILQGTLMFADRFTRDLNLLKGLAHYPHQPNGKLYDPSHNYLLKVKKIELFPFNQTSSINK